MARLRTLALLPLVALLLVACGGGGGGDDAPADTGAPGTLRALALEGDAAPDSGGGTFDVFPTFPILGAGNGGWAAFVAPVTGGTTNAVLYVALPDGSGTIVRVYGEGDAVSGTARFLDGFSGAWMLENGTVIALVDLAGGMGTETFALIAADVDTGGVVSNQRTILVHEGTLAPAIPGGLLASIDALSLRVELDGTLWMQISDSVGGETHIVSIEDDGTGLTRRASTADTVFGGQTITSIDAFGMDAAGDWYAFAMTDSGGDRRMIMCDASAAPPGNYQEVLKDGNPLPSGVGTVADAWKGGRITVYGNATCAWVCKGTQSGADDIFMLLQLNAVQPYVEMARVTDTAPDTGMGTWSSLDTLNSAPSAQRVLCRGAVGGGTLGVTYATFRVDGISPLNVRGDTANIVLSGGAIEPASYINLTQTTRPYDEVSFDGGMIYANTWLTTSAIWWVTRSGVLNNTNPIAAQGGPAPGGDTFGSFTGGVGMTTANGVVLFRAPVTNAGTGIFRQGP